MPAYTPTWVLLSDGSRGRVLVQESRRAHLIRAFGEGFAARRVGGDEARFRASASALVRRAGDLHAEAREQAEHEFCVTVAEFLSRAAYDRRFERLILVAPPRTLADLRGSLSPQARALVHAEVTRDWIDLPDAEIEARLGGALQAPLAAGA